MSAAGRKTFRKTAEEPTDSPFDGLFGDTAELRVLQEVVADPYSDYSHHDLMELTELSDPSVRKGIRVLLDHGIVSNVSPSARNPLYRPNSASRKLAALMFLTYAILDDKTGSDSMDTAVKDYCDQNQVYIDFLKLRGGKKGGRGAAEGARVYMPEGVAEKLGDVLQDVLKKASKECRVQRLRAAH